MKKAAKGVPVGAEITTPHACVTAKAIAENAAFVQIASDQLTQTAYGMMKVPDYFKDSPLDKLDQEGVGSMMELCANDAKDGELGIEGRHCADPDSIKFFYKIGAKSITCAPSVVPIARLCAAQAVISAK